MKTKKKLTSEFKAALKSTVFTGSCTGKHYVDSPGQENLLVSKLFREAIEFLLTESQQKRLFIYQSLDQMKEQVILSEH